MKSSRAIVSSAVCVFGYKRPWHLRETLDALERNHFADKLPVIIFIDGPKSSADKQNVSEVLSVARKTRRFKEQIIVDRGVNLGLFCSLTQGISEVLESYNSVIVIEDDIRTSPFFLDYVLHALDRYESFSSVASIHGYTPPIKQTLPETFFLRGADCWGWATWRDRWQLFRHDAGAMAQEIRERGLVHEFNLYGNYDYLGMLEARAAGRSNSWAICWHASCFLANKLTLYPGKSLVKNIGLDNSGEHCGPSKIMETELPVNPIQVLPIPTRVESHVFAIYCKHFKVKSSKIYQIRKIVKRLSLALQRLVNQKDRVGLCLDGPFSTYDEAYAKATGYDSPIVLEKVRQATVDVLEGRGIYERDGTVFSVRPNNIKIRHLLKKYIQPNMIVVDFGGGLGSTFINNKDLFNESHQCIVIEQQNFVEVGKKIHSQVDSKIYFYSSLEKLKKTPNILIFSSVLQYLSDMTRVLSSTASLKPEIIIIDRTAFIRRGSMQWWLQQESTYYGTPISYPVRPLLESSILEALSGYSVVERWVSTFDPQRPAHRGLLLQRCN